MPYCIDFTEDAEQYLHQLPLNDSRRIKEKLLFLESVANPRKYLVKIEGKYQGKVYRYRIGVYRVLLTFKDQIMVIVVIDIGNRKNIYN